MAVRDHDPESGSLDPASGMNTGNPSREAASVLLSGDPISDVLDTVCLQGAVFFLWLWEPVWPYGMSVADGRDLSPYLVPGTDCIVSYHIVTQGPCWAAVSAASPVRLETGDTLILPRGDPYRISSAPENPGTDNSDASIEFFKTMSAGDIPPVVRDGGHGPERNELICGFPRRLMATIRCRRSLRLP